MENHKKFEFKALVLPPPPLILWFVCPIAFFIVVVSSWNVNSYFPQVDTFLKEKMHMGSPLRLCIGALPYLIIWFFILRKIVLVLFERTINITFLNTQIDVTINDKKKFIISKQNVYKTRIVQINQERQYSRFYIYRKKQCVFTLYQFPKAFSLAEFSAFINYYKEYFGLNESHCTVKNKGNSIITNTYNHV